jgi:sugar phosphate permease
MDSFQWNQSEVTRPATLMFVTIAFLAPLVGILLDKHRPKLIMGVGLFIILAALLAYRWVDSLALFTLVYLLFAVGLTLGGIVTSMYLITKWFSKYRGMAVGIFLMASSVGGAIFPKIAGWFTLQYNWQTAALVLVFIASIFTILPFLFLIKNSPQEVGEFPDGIESNYQRQGNKTVIKDISLQKAINSPNFYLLLFVTATLWFCITGVINHQTIFFEKDLQLPKSEVTSMGSIFFISSFIGKFLFGALSDRFNKKNIMLLAVLNLLIGSIILRNISINPSVLTFVHALVYGIGFSGAFTMIQVLIADLYGGNAYGKILGIFTMIDTLAGSLGIFLLGNMRTNSTSYDNGFNLLIGLCAVAAVCVLLIKSKNKLSVNNLPN